MCRLKQLEKGFVLDGVPMSHLVNDETGRTNPSINMGIPQYNALDDKSCAGYFQRKGLPRVVKKSKEVRGEGGRGREKLEEGGREERGEGEK